MTSNLINILQIITDIELLNRDEPAPMHTEEAALQGIKKIFDRALSPLKETIDREEAEGDCNIMIHILPEMDEWGLKPELQTQGLRLTLSGYSDELAIKIQQAVLPILEASREEIS